MKLLQLNAEFMLTDDFEGTFSEALREMATYCESEDAATRHEDHGKADTSITVKELHISQLSELKKKNEENGTRAAYGYFLGEWEL